jgi:hypothetical protein
MKAQKTANDKDTRIISALKVVTMPYLGLAAFKDDYPPRFELEELHEDSTILFELPQIPVQRFGSGAAVRLRCDNLTDEIHCIFPNRQSLTHIGCVARDVGNIYSSLIEMFRLRLCFAPSHYLHSHLQFSMSTSSHKRADQTLAPFQYANHRSDASKLHPTISNGQSKPKFDLHVYILGGRQPSHSPSFCFLILGKTPAKIKTDEVITAQSCIPKTPLL